MPHYTPFLHFGFALYIRVCFSDCSTYLTTCLITFIFDRTYTCCCTHTAGYLHIAWETFCAHYLPATCTQRMGHIDSQFYLLSSLSHLSLLSCLPQALIALLLHILFLKRQAGRGWRRQRLCFVLILVSVAAARPFFWLRSLLADQASSSSKRILESIWSGQRIMAARGVLFCL